MRVLAMQVGGSVTMLTSVPEYDLGVDMKLALMETCERLKREF